MVDPEYPRESPYSKHFDNILALNEQLRECLVVKKGDVLIFQKNKRTHTKGMAGGDTDTSTYCGIDVNSGPFIITIGRAVINAAEVTTEDIARARPVSTTRDFDEWKTHYKAARDEAKTKAEQKTRAEENDERRRLEDQALLQHLAERTLEVIESEDSPTDSA